MPNVCHSCATTSVVQRPCGLVVATIRLIRDRRRKNASVAHVRMEKQQLSVEEKRLKVEQDRLELDKIRLQWMPLSTHFVDPPFVFPDE